MTTVAFLKYYSSVISRLLSGLISCPHHSAEGSVLVIDGPDSLNEQGLNGFMFMISNCFCMCCIDLKSLNLTVNCISHFLFNLMITLLFFDLQLKFIKTYLLY